eukprot:s2116_g16.t1
MAAAIAAALQQSVPPPGSFLQVLNSHITSCLSQDGPEAFEAFRRAVTQAARGREAPPKQLLGGLDDKDKGAKGLGSEKPWHRALCQAEGLRARLPEDLEACVAEVPEDEQSAEARE